MINKTSLFFKRIDKIIFEQIEFFKRTPFYEEFWERLESLSHGQGKIFAQALSGMVILMPLLVALIFWLGNSNLKNSLEVKKQISQTIHDYNRKLSVSAPLKSDGISHVPLRSKEDFTDVFNKFSDKKKNIKIERIKFKKISKKMGRAKVMLGFNNLTTGSLVGMIKNLAIQYKARVSHIHINKNEILKTLKGEVEFVFYSTIASTEKKK